MGHRVVYVEKQVIIKNKTKTKQKQKQNTAVLYIINRLRKLFV